MSPLTFQTDEATQCSSYVLRVAAVAAVSGLLFGFDTAVINGALVLLRTDFHLTDFQTELVATALLAGCLAGAASAGALSDRFGRKKTLIGASLLFAGSSLGAALARTLMDLSFARIAGGLAIGLASAVAPVYVSEIAAPQVRGRLVSLNQLAIVTGILVAYLSNWGLSTLGASSWRWMFAVGVAPSIGLLVGLLFIPESFRWLIVNGRAIEGRAVLERVVGRAAASAQFAEIESATSNDLSGSALTLFTGKLRKRIIIATVLAVAQQVTGINTVLYYGSVLFHEQFREKSVTAAIGANVLVGLVNLACTLVAILFIDRWGRRALLLTASGGMAISLCILAVSFRLPAVAPAVAFVSVLLYVGFFAIGLGPAVWVYISEIFPTKLRGRATSVATTALWAACCAVTLTFLSIVHGVGTSGAFSIYAALSLFTFGFVWKWVPETRGRSLEEIQRGWDT